MSGPKKPRSQRAIARGHAAELRAKGVTLDRNGRARLGGRFLSTASLERRVARLTARRRDARTTADRQLQKHGLTPKQIAALTTAEIAGHTGVSEATAKKWKTRGGMPDEAADTIRARLTNERVYAPTWKHGTRTKATRDELRELKKAFRAFVRSRQLDDPRTHKAYTRWKRLKEFVRSQLTKEAWRAIVNRLGKGEGLSKFGAFSVQRFVTS